MYQPEAGESKRAIRLPPTFTAPRLSILLDPGPHHPLPKGEEKK